VAAIKILPKEKYASSKKKVKKRYKVK